MSTTTVNLTQLSESITFSANDGDESITLRLNELARGPAGSNTISGTTTTSLSGILKGSGGVVAEAVAGTDYLVPSALTGLKVTRTFADQAEMDSSTPDFNGQIGIKLDTQTLVLSIGLTAGAWESNFSLGNIDAGTILATDSIISQTNIIASGHVAGSNISLDGNIIGNAATATALQTARTINGVPFDGTAGITVAAAAGTLTGTTLASNVVTSSLTSVGTLTSLTVTSSIITTAGNIAASAGSAIGIVGRSRFYSSSDGTMQLRNNANTADASLTAAGLTLSTTPLAASSGGTGLTALGTGVATALGVNVGSAGAFVTFNGALGTPSSGTLTNCNGLPTTGITGASDFLTIGPSEVSITGATTLTSTAFGKQHVCSGTSADYAVTLPTVTSNAGRIISIRMSNALTKFVTLTAAGAALIDGVATRIMWAQESCVLYCDGTNWTKIAGKSRPMMASGENGAGVSVTNITSTPISLTTTIRNGTGAMIDTVSSINVIRIKRTGNYQISALVTLSRSGSFVGFEAYCTPFINSISAPATNPSFLSVVPTSYDGASFTYAHIALSSTRYLTSGDYVALGTYQNTGGTMTTRTIDVVRPNLSVVEIPDW